MVGYPISGGHHLIDDYRNKRYVVEPQSTDFS
jgi:hypothetical protein